MGRLDGKIALVTGASRGIGRAIALELAHAGASVSINYLSAEDEAQAVADEIAKFGGKTLLLQANVSDKDQVRGMVKQAVEHFGQLDILVNNAGITRDRSMRKLTDDDWTEVINTNLNSVYYCTTAAMQGMIDHKFGRIINISSYVGQAGNFGQANYAASKGGIIAFTKTAAIELAKYNITVNSIAPGFTLTEMLAKVPANVQDQIKAKIPMGRFGLPEEVAKAVAFLAADGDYITGQQININGGVYM
ncbi:MAG: 3-oxoacyl-[acyl-carrier-protein] reductase [Herpetosiphonaceae bacterium]|nr:3-oxoacyl-[acyl-carrier-protein] reductase [Herpetosiphonaceae bacterium]